jgi:hypothetical protein
LLAADPPLFWNEEHNYSIGMLLIRVVDPFPDPDWIRISDSGSVLGIRIQGQENEKISVGKCTF